MDVSSPVFKTAEIVRNESVITVTGKVVAREAATVNPRLATGGIELDATEMVVQSMAETLPIPVHIENDTTPEELRLRYRFLDLRKDKLHRNIMLRSQVIASLRRRMIEQGFIEFQTPILTADSPEGARYYLVPSRLHPGKFYALPQAPQQFKQLLMVSGFDRYFQIAPCFRDEDARADRAPGEFYQLDFEMSFVTQDDVFAAIEPVLHGVFEEFAGFGRETPRKVTPFPFPRIPYAEALLTYGTDKPDLRNPLRIVDVGEVFAGSDFKVFAGIVAAGGVVRALRAPGAAGQPRSFFDKLNDWAQGEGKPGLGYIVLEGGAGKGPIAKFVTGERLARLRELTGAADGDAVFFVADKPEAAWKFAGQARTRVGQELGLIAEDTFEFCWIVDFPMFEYDETAKKIDFSHNPFSMPQGGLEALETQDPLDHQGLAVRHRLQRHRALLRRDPQPSARHHVQGLRHRGLQQRGGRAALRRHAQRLPLRRPAARRRRARRRPHRHAAGRRAQHPRGHRLPDEPAGRRPDDGGADRAAAGEAARAAYRPAPAAGEEGLASQTRGATLIPFKLSSDP